MHIWVKAHQPLQHFYKEIEMNATPQDDQDPYALVREFGMQTQEEMFQAEVMRQLTEIKNEITFIKSEIAFIKNEIAYVPKAQNPYNQVIPSNLIPGAYYCAGCGALCIGVHHCPGLGSRTG